MKEQIFEPDKYLEFFKEIAFIYDTKDNAFLEYEKEFLIDKIYKFASSHKDMASILDLGAGSGRVVSDLLPILARERKLSSVTLVDPSRDMLDLCRIKMKQHLTPAISLEFIQNTAEGFISQCDRRFDIILLDLVCSVAGIPNGFFDAVRHLLNNEGMLIFSDIHPLKMQTSPFFKLDCNGILFKLRLKGYSEHELFKQVMQADFSITHVLTINENIYMPYMLILLLEKG